MEFARSSGWHSYVGHNETMDIEDHKRAYNTWREGQDSRVMVATSVFSMGNNHLHVCLVLHMDKPFDMLEYVRAQRRAGQDGAPATHKGMEGEQQGGRKREGQQAGHPGPPVFLWCQTLSALWHHLLHGWDGSKLSRG